jgi:hypothetical protein
MRITTGLLAIVLFAGTTLCASAATFSGGPAPADEYFGPHHQSVLEIRNRLDRFDTKTNMEMLQPGIVNELDDVSYSISDWRHQYPGDPWLPHAYARLLFSYHRAGAVSDARATVALAEMRSSYADEPETGQTLAMLYGNAYGAPQISLFTAVGSNAPAGKVEAPAPIAIAAPAPVRATSGAWARFDSMRTGH